MSAAQQNSSVAGPNARPTTQQPPVYELSSDSEEEIGLDADDDDLEIISSAALTWTRHDPQFIPVGYAYDSNGKHQECGLKRGYKRCLVWKVEQGGSKPKKAGMRFHDDFHTWIAEVEYPEPALSEAYIGWWLDRHRVNSVVG
ncbi:MAG: hypothetical protein LQ351_008117 [Letrouitia transgressa]|nr:MAG: hypothetical protein LQ351_008117 [Letrouitia transgressa]